MNDAVKIFSDESILMEPRIETLTQKKLVGKHLRMSFSEDRTFELWKSFMPLRKHIKNPKSADLFSLQVHSSGFDFENFNINAGFEKWAAMEVNDFESVPEGMGPFLLEGGLYAVFIHKGSASSGPETFRYIFGIWLPGSDYIVDNRPHFEILGEKYKHEDPQSEEEVWIPIKPKSNRK